MGMLNWSNAFSMAGGAIATVGLEGVKASLEQDRIRLADQLAGAREATGDERRAAIAEKAAVSAAAREPATAAARENGILGVRAEASDNARKQEIREIAAAQKPLDDKTRTGMMNAFVGPMQTEGGTSLTATPEQLQKQFPLSDEQDEKNWLTAARQAGYIGPKDVMTNESRIVTATLMAKQREYATDTKLDIRQMQNDMLKYALDHKADPTERLGTLAVLGGNDRKIERAMDGQTRLQLKLDDITKGVNFDPKNPDAEFVSTQNKIKDLDRQITVMEAMNDSLARGLGVEMPAAKAGPPAAAPVTGALADPLGLRKK